MLSVVLAAALTFTATATGVEKGTPVEFVFAGQGTDRDYETMFVLDDTPSDFCAKLEKAGLPRGKPTDAKTCRLWPVGCKLTFSPPLDTYIKGQMPEGYSNADPIYTGGTRLADGALEAQTNMPLSVFSIYTLAQSPIVYDGVYPQGAVYNSFTALRKLEKGVRVTFTVRWDSTTMPKPLHLTARPGKAVELIATLKDESETGPVDVLLGFDDNLTVREATAVSEAMSTIDSPRVKLNGVTNIFYRSFLPLVKWRDRRERPMQPFELTLGNTDKLVFIEEDWNHPGDDPKLTPREISFVDAAKYSQTTTCFIYTSQTSTVGRIVRSMEKLKGSSVFNWYVFTEQ